MIRVLVVDDDFHVAHAHALSVARMPGFAVVGEAHTGAEALDLVTSADARPAPARHVPARLQRPRAGPPAGRLRGTCARLPPRHSGPGHRGGAHRDAARGLLLPRQAVQLRALNEQLESYRAWVQRLDRVPQADQQVIDTLYSLRGTPSRARRRPARSSRRWPGSSRSSHRRRRRSAPPRWPRSSAPAARPPRGTSLPSSRSSCLDLDLSYGATGRPEHRYLRRRG